MRLDLEQASAQFGRWTTVQKVTFRHSVSVDIDYVYSNSHSINLFLLSSINVFGFDLRIHA